MASATDGKTSNTTYVGTLVGESTSTEFRLALAAESVRVQDIVAVDVELMKPDAGTDESEQLRVWAKVQRIELINPLFPAEAGHELAATRTDPFDTVLSLSREMVSAVCQVLGTEPLDHPVRGKLGHLRYPPRPAASAYQPANEDIARIVAGELKANERRALDLATLSNRPEVDVHINGHAVVTRHLAILAMTGAGKSWTARRLIEELARQHYPIVIFDPHGDYVGLGDVGALRNRVQRYYAFFPVFEEDSDTVAQLVSNLGYPLSDTMATRFSDLFQAAVSFYRGDDDDSAERSNWLATCLNNDAIRQFGIRPDLWLVADLAEAAEVAIRRTSQSDIQQMVTWGWNNLATYSGQDARTLDAIKKRTRRAAGALRRMEQINRRVAGAAAPLPVDRTELVRYDGISIVSLAGYTGDVQATIFSIIADGLFEKKLQNELRLPVLFILEEAHNFAPAQTSTPAERRAVTSTRQIAQEGRKFGVGLVLISQRPSRLDETALSQCNSYVIMRMANPADQNYVRRVVETLGSDEARMLPDLDVGEALLTGQFVNFPVLVRIKEPESRGEREETDAFDALEKVYRDMQTDSRR